MALRYHAMLRSQRAIAITFELASFGSMETQFHT